MNTNSKRPLTYRDLDKMGCDTPNCAHDHSVIYLHARCHMKSGVAVRYEKRGAQLVIECLKCSREMARIYIGPPVIEVSKNL